MKYLDLLTELQNLNDDQLLKDVSLNDIQQQQLVKHLVHLQQENLND